MEARFTFPDDVASCVGVQRDRPCGQGRSRGCPVCMSLPTNTPVWNLQVGRSHGSRRQRLAHAKSGGLNPPPPLILPVLHSVDTREPRNVRKLWEFRDHGSPVPSWPFSIDTRLAAARCLPQAWTAWRNLCALVEKPLFHD